jgi:hypothetical protein
MQIVARLGAMLPSGCVPIVITDAGFRSPWFQLINALGWLFVGCVRNRDMVGPIGGGAFIGVKRFVRQPRQAPRRRGAAFIGRMVCAGDRFSQLLFSGLYPRSIPAYGLGNAMIKRVGRQPAKFPGKEPVVQLQRVGQTGNLISLSQQATAHSEQ